MASVQAALHALAGLGEISLEALAERLNEIVYSSTEGNRYVTAFFAMVDAPTEKRRSSTPAIVFRCCCAATAPWSASRKAAP